MDTKAELQGELLKSASFGGPSWVPRVQSHCQELKSEVFWSPCGVSQEWAPLRSVLLTWPQDSLATDNLDAALLLRRVDVQRMRRQTEQLAAFYEAQGIRVYLYRPTTVAPPNLIFMRDTFFMTPKGACVGRMGGQARAGEERFVAEALAANGVAIVRSIIGTGCFEGADALWVSDKKVLVAGGFRTNREGMQQLSAMLAEMGVAMETVTLPRGTQHLLGAVNFVNPHTAVVRAELLTTELALWLEKNGITVIAMLPNEELVHKRAMNFVTLRPNSIVMPSDCPLTRKIYEQHGIECFEADVSEYIHAGGALGCLTGIVERSTQDRGAT